jgi:hypothetical protein
VLPYFRKSEGLCPNPDIVIDAPAHNTTGPLGVSVRSPILPGASEFVDAAVASGIPRGDYNGRDRGGPSGVASLFQTTTKQGERSSTYRAFLEGEPESRPNLTILGPDALPAAMESLKPEAQRRLVEWATTGHSLASSSLYDAGVWFSTGLGDLHSHDGQIACFLSGYTPDLWSACLNVDLAQYFDDAATQLAPDKESIIILANPVLRIVKARSF